MSNPFFAAAADPEGAAASKMAAHRVPWEDAKKKLSLPPDADVKAVEHAYRSAVARAGFAGQGEPLDLYLLRRSIPAISTGWQIGEAERNRRSAERIAAGTATQDDYYNLAEAERLSQIDRERSVRDATLSTAAKLPAVVGELALGGTAVRAGLAGLGVRIGAKGLGALGTTGGLAARTAGQAAVIGAATPLAPSTYVENAVRRAERQGGNWYDVKNLGVAGAHAVVNNALLGHTQKVAAAVRGGLLARTAGGAAVGALEQQAGDAAVSWLDTKLPEHLRTHTRYGLWGNLARGERGEAMKALAAQVMTAGFISAMQPAARAVKDRGPVEIDTPHEYRAPQLRAAVHEAFPVGGDAPDAPRRRSDPVKAAGEALGEYARRGFSADHAAGELLKVNVLIDAFRKRERREPSAGEVRWLAREAFPDGTTRRYMYAVADSGRFVDAVAWQGPGRGPPPVPQLGVGRPPLPFSRRLPGEPPAGDPGRPDTIITQFDADPGRPDAIVGPDAPPPASPEAPGTTIPPEAPEARPAGDRAAGEAVSLPVPPEVVAKRAVDRVVGKYGLEPPIITDPEHPYWADEAARGRASVALGQGGFRGVAIRTDLLARHKPMSGETPQSVSDFYPNPVEGAAVQEAVHVLERVALKTGAWNRLSKDIPRSTWAAISENAAANNRESFAEAWMARDLGRPLPADVTAALAEMDRQFDSYFSKPGAARSINASFREHEAALIADNQAVNRDRPGAIVHPVERPRQLGELRGEFDLPDLAGGQPDRLSLPAEPAPPPADPTQVRPDRTQNPEPPEPQPGKGVASEDSGPKSAAPGSDRPLPRPTPSSEAVRAGLGRPARKGLSPQAKDPTKLGRVGDRVAFDPELYAVEGGGTGFTAVVVRPGKLAPDGTVLEKPVVRRLYRQYEKAEDDYYAEKTAAQQRAIDSWLNEDVPPQAMDLRPEFAAIFAGKNLNPTEQLVVQMTADGIRQAGIAEKLDITRERVRQLANRAGKTLGISGSLDKAFGKPAQADEPLSRVEAREARGAAPAAAELRGDVDPATGKPLRKRSRSALRAQMDGFEKQHDALVDEFMKAADAGDAAALADITASIAALGKKARSVQAAIDATGGVKLHANPLPEAIAKFRQAAAFIFDWRRSVGRVPLDFDTKNRFPRYADNFTAAFTVPEGLAKFPLLARLFGPTGVEWSKDGQALLAHRMKRAIGNNVAAWWAKRNEPAREAIDYDGESGTIGLTNGKRGHLSDFAEAELKRPGSQPLPKAFTDWLHNSYQPDMNDLRRMLKENGIDYVLDENGNRQPLSPYYFPRPAVGKKGVKGSSSAGPTGTRDFATEKDGADYGIVYDPDLVSRVTKVVSGAYRAVASHQLANDPALGALGGPPVFLVSRAANVKHRSFQGKVFLEETAKKIEKHLAAVEPRPWERGLSVANDFAKALALGHDASVLFVQMLSPLMSGTYRGKPVGQLAWAKGAANFFKEAFREGSMGEYLRRPENDRAARELVQAGSSVGRLTDFLAGMERGQPAERIPVIGRGVRWSGRTFGAAVDTVKIEYWKAIRDSVPPDQRIAAIQAIDSMIGSGRMETAGVSPLQTLGERLLFLAPSLYRGGLNMATGWTQRGVAGAIARRAVAGQIFATASLAYLAMDAVGLDDDEKAERFDPRSGKFMAVPVTLGDGSVVNVRFGNILLSFARLLGDLAETQTNPGPGGPAKVVGTWLRTHSSPTVRTGFDLYDEADAFGRPQTRPETAARAVTPIAFQDALHGDRGLSGDKPTRHADAAAAGLSVFGAQARPESDPEARRRAWEAEARRKYGAKFDGLSFPERAAVMKAVPAPPRDRPDPAAVARAREADDFRARELYDSLSGAAKMRLAEAGFGPRNTPGYETSFDVGGQSVPLTKGERRAYAALLAQKYEAALAGLKLSGLYSESGREKAVRRALDAARETARETIKAAARR